MKKNCPLGVITTKIIIVSLIDNLVKGAAGQAVQSFNVSNDFEENLALVT